MSLGGWWSPAKILLWVMSLWRWDLLYLLYHVILCRIMGDVVMEVRSVISVISCYFVSYHGGCRCGGEIWAEKITPCLIMLYNCYIMLYHVVLWGMLSWRWHKKRTSYHVTISQRSCDTIMVFVLQRLHHMCFQEAQQHIVKRQLLVYLFSTYISELSSKRKQTIFCRQVGGRSNR